MAAFVVSGVIVYIVANTVFIIIIILFWSK